MAQHANNTSPGKQPPRDKAATQAYESHDNPRARLEQATVHRAGQPQNGSGFRHDGARPGQTCDWYGDPLDGMGSASENDPATQHAKAAGR